MEKVCAKNSQQLVFKDVPLFDPDWNVPYIIYLPLYNMLYCGVPKAGTTTWVEGKIYIDSLNFKAEFTLTRCYV
jgi:hypothetical protein